MRRDVRILLVGDGSFVYFVRFISLQYQLDLSEGVGKSTIITSLIKESFVSQVLFEIIYL